MLNKKRVVLILAVITIFGVAVSASAMMTGGMMGDGSMMTSDGGFGMMGGIAGGPIVGTDGTAYLTSMMPSATPGTYPTSSSFVSHMMAVSTTGQTLKLSVSGMMSRPAFASGITVSGTTGDYVMATSSLPKMSDYSIMQDYSSTTEKSVLFWMRTPFTTSSVPVAVVNFIAILELVKESLMLLSL
jgi:hypothetical protein